MHDDSDRLDREFALLASRERRAILDRFVSAETEVATVEELSRHLTRVVADGGEAESPSTGVVRARLHHVHLPKLERHGLVEHDPRSGTVRYQSDERIERILTLAAEL
ncbi:hypothetical protein NGM10_01270 [Halorussus salilacus]|uniref:DUF7344 domain-containing protein n=1 Tax=Halorussus salilacus TaxID=2953750 RepID=UPI00209D8B1D|nr:hypothetical protein [Halorussus salilacus]USZ68384.1 hypothetical protein NGM10_01270 [Halorussus salilacus]